MLLKEISHLPDDILTKIFYYLENPLKKELKAKKKDIYFLETNKETNTNEYIFYKNINEKRNVMMVGDWDSLWDNNMRGRLFLHKKYNPYQICPKYGTVSHVNEGTCFISNLQKLKEYSLAQLKELTKDIKKPSKCRTKKDLIQLILKL
tara:strand:+ start:586 stop:1032 length:447 start_codon:yes stop_codon:yes gene_type:complete